LISASAFATSARAGEPDGPRLVAICEVDAPAPLTSAMALLYNYGDSRAPSFSAVMVWRGRTATQAVFADSAVHSLLENRTVDGEEIHFDSPGFKLEVVTNLENWSDGILPGTDTTHPEKAVGTLWTVAGKQPIDGARVSCEFKR
jgi:hypothetical protein